MRVLQADTPTQAQRTLRKMEERGVTRKRLRGQAPKNVAKPVKKAPIPISTLRKRVAAYLAKTLDRPDALVMLTLHSTLFDRESALRALTLDADDIRSEAASAPTYEFEGEGLVNPFWYHPTPYAYIA